MVATRLFANPAVKIGAIEARVKRKQHPRLVDPVARGARGVLAHAVGDQVFDPFKLKPLKTLALMCVPSQDQISFRG